MAITFPRELPNYRMQECWFDIADNIAASISGNGTVINLSQTVDPVWQGTFATGILYPDQQALWSAWRKSLRAGLKTFLAYDIRRAAPLAYPFAKVPGDILSGWNGTATVTALGLSGALSLSGLPAAYQFKAGDRIGLEQAGYYGYHEIVEDVAAVAGVAVVTVTPFLFTGLFTTSAVARVWRPKCQFVIDPKSWTESGVVEPSNVTFKASQRL